MQALFFIACCPKLVMLLKWSSIDAWRVGVLFHLSCKLCFCLYISVWCLPFAFGLQVEFDFVDQYFSEELLPK